MVAGPGAAPEVVASVAPAVGAGAIVIAGVAAARAGIHLHGGGGVVTYLVAAGAGWAGAAFGRRRRIATPDG